MQDGLGHPSAGQKRQNALNNAPARAPAPNVGSGKPGEAPSPLPVERFQILSLDGGGYRGIYSAAVLAAIEEDLGTPITQYFDLIAGTSTGGIIAIGLGAGLRPRDIVEFYARWGPKIFRKQRLRTGFGLWRRKYGSETRRHALTEVLGERTLGDSACRLVIPAYDLGADAVYIFKTPHNIKLKRDWKERLVDVAMATSAAPTYFQAASLAGIRLVDGGVWANNPTNLRNGASAPNLMETATLENANVAAALHPGDQVHELGSMQAPRLTASVVKLCGG